MKLIMLTLLFIVTNNLKAQTKNPWKGKKAAVVLTYDDALNQQLDNAIPILDSLQLKATFYVTTFSESMQKRVYDWKKITKKGHELGNHTLFHPCVGGVGREWVSKENDLATFSVNRIENEIRMTNLFLKILDGKPKRTFAFTCGDMKVQDSSFIDGLKADFVGARVVRHQLHTIDSVDVYNIDCYMVNNHTYEQMKEWIDIAIETKTLLVILFHGVGGGSGLDVSLANHRKILHYIKQKQNEIWVAPMVDVADYIKKYQSKKYEH